MQEILGSKVRHIIPPIESNSLRSMPGLVRSADALKWNYVNNRQYIDDWKCTIILFENPPYGNDFLEHQRTEQEKIVAVEKEMTLWFLKRRRKLKAQLWMIWECLHLVELSEYYLRQDWTAVLFILREILEAQHHRWIKNLWRAWLQSPSIFIQILRPVSWLHCGAEKDCTMFSVENFDIDDDGTLSEEILLHCT